MNACLCDTAERCFAGAGGEDMLLEDGTATAVCAMLLLRLPFDWVC